MDALEAILRTGAQRLRPVLLTTVTTLLGLLPVVLGINVDVIGRAVSIGGPSTQWWTHLAFATLLTLVSTPALLILGERLKKQRPAFNVSPTSDSETAVNPA